MINDLWYKNAVIYCLNVGTYMDSNADGVGDFQGSCAGSTTCTGWA
jgi:maltose alpha-D-glucosyltransferase/alpha-amylase